MPRPQNYRSRIAEQNFRSNLVPLHASRRNWKKFYTKRFLRFSGFFFPSQDFHLIGGICIPRTFRVHLEGERSCVSRLPACFKLSIKATYKFRVRPLDYKPPFLLPSQRSPSSPLILSCIAPQPVSPKVPDLSAIPHSTCRERQPIAIGNGWPASKMPSNLLLGPLDMIHIFALLQN